MFFAKRTDTTTSQFRKERRLCIEDLINSTLIFLSISSESFELHKNKTPKIVIIVCLYQEIVTKFRRTCRR